MPKALGHVEDLDPAVNTSYFVSIDGDNASYYHYFIMTHEYLPSRTLENVQTFMVNNRDYRLATSGYLVQANLSLECHRNQRGSYTCPNTGYIHNKLSFLSPMIFNPLILHQYFPNGNIEFSPVFPQPRPDRTVRIPINMIRIGGFNDLQSAIFRAPSFQSPPHFPGNDQGTAFRIYQDPPNGNNNMSVASTVSVPPSETSSTVVSGNLKQTDSKIQTDSEEFDPSATSTRTPKTSEDLYADPTPGPSEPQPKRGNDRFIKDKPKEKAESSPGKGKSPKGKKSPRKSMKSPWKSPKHLRRTPSQPAITSYIPGRSPAFKRRSSPPTSRSLPVAKKCKPKRILSDLNEDERREAADLEAGLLLDDSSITEAVVNPDTMPSATGMSNDDSHLFPTPVDSPPQAGPPLSLGQLQRAASNSSTLPSRSEFDVSPPSDETIAYINPLDLESSSQEERGSSAGTSNEAGRFDENVDEDVKGDPEVDVKGDPEEVNQPADTGDRIQPEDNIVFDIRNTIVGEANLDNAPRPRRMNETPEHVLLVLEDDNVITHILNFRDSHNPEDILEAFWNRSLNMMTPDEGFEASSSSSPPPPPPTPSSSTEAQKGSSNEASFTSPQPIPVKIANPADDSDLMILNISDMPKEDIVKKEEEEERGEREKGETKRKGGHAN